MKRQHGCVRALCIGMAAASGALGVLFAGLLAGCAREHPPPPVRSPAERAPEPTRFESTTAYRARLGHGAELYVPPWFRARPGGYDLVVHFHGLPKLQEANIERAQLNAAVVSVNVGVGTAPYAAAFRDPRAFEELLAVAHAEIDKSGQAPGAKLRKLALSAWSAGFVSVHKVLASPRGMDRVDAVLLADGFFTAYTDLKKRTINTASLGVFVDLVEAAARGDKLLAITHTTIPTVGYPSVGDTVAKVLELAKVDKTPSSATGPREMRELYAVDRGALHVRGFEGVTAAAHVKQIQAMGETLYPYLRDRWTADDGR